MRAARQTLWTNCECGKNCGGVLCARDFAEVKCGGSVGLGLPDVPACLHARGRASQRATQARGSHFVLTWRDRIVFLAGNQGVKVSSSPVWSLLRSFSLARSLFTCTSEIDGNFPVIITSQHPEAVPPLRQVLVESAAGWEGRLEGYVLGVRRHERRGQHPQVRFLMATTPQAFPLPILPFLLPSSPSSLFSHTNPPPRTPSTTTTITITTSSSSSSFSLTAHDGLTAPESHHHHHHHYHSSLTTSTPPPLPSFLNYLHHQHNHH